MDMNDRALRKINVNYDSEFSRIDGFDISVASEIMAILCLSKDLADLKTKLSNILIGYTYDDKPVYAKDLKIADALALLLKDAIKPNLVQTLENNPAIIHGGPFANIAHGCNSIIATKLALSLSDYVVTEAGFGSDLGAEKFLDIKCRYADIKPNCIVINSTIRSLKHNGGCPKEELSNESIEYLEKGICNLQVHIENMKLYTKNIIVCLNKFYTDTDKEIEYVKSFVENLNVEFEISESHQKGGNGALELAKKIVKICDNKVDYKPLYDINLALKEKIESVCKNIYHAKEIIYNDGVLDKLNMYEKLGYKKCPVCVAKTQYSITDDAKLLGYPKDNTLTVRDVKVSSGAGFVVIYMGNILTMPGLSKKPAYEGMTITDDGIINGLY
jgi:formate--tetrahydrofolate ligase